MLRGNLAADLALNRRSRSAAMRRFSFEPIRLAGLPLADLGCESGIVEYCLIAISVKRILYGPGNLPGPFCLPGRQLRLLKDASKPVAQPCGRFFAIMGQFSGEKI